MDSLPLFLVIEAELCSIGEDSIMSLFTAAVVEVTKTDEPALKLEREVLVDLERVLGLRLSVSRCLDSSTFDLISRSPSEILCRVDIFLVAVAEDIAVAFLTDFVSCSLSGDICKMSGKRGNSNGSRARMRHMLSSGKYELE